MNYLRPDEKAAQADIERSQMQNERAKSAVNTGINLATGFGAAGIAARGASTLSSKIMPFINKYIPTDMAIKGISKASPEIGGLLKKGMEQGLNIQDGLDFIKGKMEPAKENRSIIEQYSPELYQFIDQEIKNGESPIAAASKASRNKKFEKEINKLVHDHKLDWTSIVESVFGNGRKAEVSGEQSKAALQGQAQKQQAGPGEQALMQTLQKINQRLGG